MASAADHLTRALGAPPQAGADELDAADAERLAGLIEQARAEQRRKLDDAIEGGLGHLPRFVRGTARSVLFR